MVRRHLPARKLRKDQLRWSGASFQFSAQAAGSSALNFITAGQQRATMMRIRGELVAYVDGVQAPGGLTDVAIGAAQVPEGTSTTALWTPITDDDAPWFLYERFTLGYEEMVNDVIGVPGLTVFRKTIDVKAMRIFRPDVEAQIVFQSATLLTAISVNLTLNVRVLFADE